MKKNIIILSIQLLSLLVIAQNNESNSNNELPNVIPPSPTVANLMKFEEVPVSYYTGQPEISIPLINKKIDITKNISLNLRYSTGGVQIDSRSSWVGTGWSLDGLGVVSRTVIGLPDDINETDKVGVLYNDFYKYPNLSIDVGEFKWNAVNGNPSFDTEIDLFQFNLLDRSARFILVRNDNDEIEARLFNLEEKYIITPVFNTVGKITSFIIKDDLGYEYYFEANEETFQSTSTYSVIQGRSGITSEYPYNSSWKLTKLISPFNLEILTIEYNNVSEIFRTEGLEKFVTVIEPMSTDFSDPVTQGGGLKGTSRSHTLHNVGTKKVKKITFYDNSYVDFTLDTGGHPEYQAANSSLSGSILKEIDLRNPNGDLITKKSLSYVTSSNNRLFLTEIKDGIVQGEEQNYYLSYTDLDDLPEYGSNKKDSWGYYKKNSPSDNPNVLIGCLESIEYPTGGKKEFLFEQHTISMVGNQDINPVDIDDNYFTKSFFSTFSASNNDESQTTGLIFLNYDSMISVIPSNLQETGMDPSFYAARFTPVLPNTNVDEDCHACNQTTDFNIDTSKDEVFYSLSQATENYFLTSGWYFITVAPGYYDTLPNSSNSVNVDLSVEYKNYNSNNPTLELKGAGFRIKEIIFKDEQQIEDHVFFKYHQFDNTNKSSGSYDGFLNNRRSYNLTENIVFKPSGKFINQNFEVTYYITETSNNHFTQLTKSSLVGYQNISVYRNNNGHIEYTYTFPGDYPTYPNDYDYPFESQPNIDFKRGLLTKKEVFSENNVKLLQEEKSYNFNEETIARSLLFRKNLEKNNPSNCAVDIFYSDYTGYVSFPYIIIFPGETSGYTVTRCGVPYEGAGGIPSFQVAGMAQLTTSTNKDYLQSNPNFIEKIQNYYYQSQFHKYLTESETITNDPTTTLRTVTKYPEDISGEPHMSTLINEHRIGIPIEVETYNQNNTLINATKTEYGIFNGKLQPRFIKSKNENNPSGNYETRIKYNRYDALGNPQEISQENGMRITYLWGYNSQYPVAKIENCGYTQIPFTIRNAIETATSTTMANALQSLRSSTNSNLQNAMITTMLYEPLVGVTQITDPKGDVQFYKYDDFGRLEQVKDKDGNIVQENDYHYRN